MARSTVTTLPPPMVVPTVAGDSHADVVSVWHVSLGINYHLTSHWLLGADYRHTAATRFEVERDVVFDSKAVDAYAVQVLYRF